ncbi:hypothetical protein ACIBCT_38870 [Streptosporangium sp. NPDC050855]|uniref:hypothetical protein n=1 Tax=Streptosporangium sp. NPDC050855 TaxID=3366194 RepID=UPI00379CA06B
MLDAPSHDRPASPLLLADGQADALMLHIGQAFPPWRIWRAGVFWYATGPCRIPGCPCSRTLHAPDPAGLCQQLEAVEQAGREQRGDRELTIEDAYLLLAGISWADETAEQETAR